MRRRPRPVSALLATVIVAGLTAPANASVPSVPGEHTVPVVGSSTVTLLTGDQVSVRRLADGTFTAEVSRAAPRTDGVHPSFTTLGTPDKKLYVIPSDAAAAIRAGTLDRELFDVSYLAANGYGDKISAALPVIAQYGGKVTAKRLAPDADALPATRNVRTLASVHGTAMSLAKSGIASFWSTLHAAPKSEASALGAGVTKLWLDGRAHVGLDQSVPQIGAPQAWAEGYTGKGVTVAVLDTGVDDTHPDLAGRISEERSFVDGVSSAKDGHGHGTHVASTIVGSGAASGGKYKGVAPDAKLIVGKVLSDAGTGSDSEIIAGMEWAAHSDAKIISMSLGTDSPSDGSDPMSQAADELSESTGALFVIAAGNAGPGRSTIGGPGAASDALTVAAVDKQDHLADFSSRGPVLGSLALKPDIAGPGVNITAARAAGTTIGTPVGDSYTTLSGTSMATPHVAGSAAILAQEHPDWTGPRLKAALMATAKDDGGTPYEQGTGRVDIGRAVGQSLLTDTSSVDFGTVPESQPTPLAKTVTLINPAATDVSVTVSPELTGPDGKPTGQFTVSPASATIPAGGTSKITVTFDPASGTRGAYGGAIKVNGPSENSSLRISVGANKIPPSHLLRVRAVKPENCDNPRHLSGCTDNVVLMPVDAPGDFILLPGAEDQQVLVPDGVYSVMTGFEAYFDPRTGAGETTVMVDPEVKVAGAAQEITLDGHDARPVTVRTDHPIHQDFTALTVSRGTAYGGRWVLRQNTKISGEVTSASELRVNPTKPVTVGTLSTTAGVLASEPLVTLALHGARGSGPRSFSPTYGDALFESAWSDKLDRRGTVGLVDVGAGTPGELAGRDLRGKIAVMSRPWNDDGGLGTLNGDAAQATIGRLRDAGALAVIAFLDSQGRPGWCADFGCSSIVNRPTPVPVLTLGPGEGAELRAAMNGGSADADIVAKPRSGYNYVLQITDDGGVVPATPTYHVPQRTLSTLHTRYHADVPGYVEEAFWPATPDGVTLEMPRYAATPSETVQYIGPADGDVLWDRSLTARVPGADPFFDTLGADPWETYTRPVNDTLDFFASPMVPGAVRYPQRMLDGWTARITPSCSFCRTPQYFRAFADDIWSAPDQRNTASFAEADTHLYRNGTEVAPLAPGSAAYDLSDHPEPARYRLTLSRTVHDAALTHATRVDSDWEYTSQAPTGAAPKGYTCYDAICRVEPLLLLRYDLTGALGLDNTAPATGAVHFTIHAYHQADAADPPVTALRLWVSYDHGEHWSPAAATARGDGAFEASVGHPEAATGTVALRVQAADAAGDTVTQTVYDAYGLKGSNARP